jgi:hypothetical protein
VTARRVPTPAHRRVIAWPANPVPILSVVFSQPHAVIRDGVIGEGPEVSRQPAELRDDVLAEGASSVEALPVDPPGELYLDLVNLDLRDEDAILDFVRCVGPIGGGFSASSEEGRFAEAILAVSGRLGQGRKNAARRFKRRRKEWSDYYRAILGSDDHVADFAAGYMSEHFVDDGETLDEFRAGAGCFRDIFRCYRWLADGAVPTDWESPVWDEARELRPRRPLDASVLLTQQLSNALVEFPPVLGMLNGLWVDDRELARIGAAALPFLPGQDLVPGEERAVLEAEYRYGQGVLTYHHDAYSVCCVQLFNHIVTRSEVRLCKNDDCPNLYVKGYQRDGTLRRRDSDWCSQTCQDRARKRRERSPTRGDPAPGAGRASGGASSRTTSRTRS